jgi:hypothetical protein
LDDHQNETSNRLRDPTLISFPSGDGVACDAKTFRQFHLSQVKAMPQPSKLGAGHAKTLSDKINYTCGIEISEEDWSNLFED